MKDYFLKIVKDGVTIDIAHTRAHNQETANGAITNIAIGRGMVNFSVQEATREEFDALHAKAVAAAPCPDQAQEAEESTADPSRVDPPEASEAQPDAGTEEITDTAETQAGDKDSVAAAA